MARSTTTAFSRLVAVAFATVLAAPGEASGVGFDLHHRSSPVVKRWAEARGHPAAAWWADAQGSPEYYSALSRHDRVHLARRGLAEGDANGKGLLTFADGNITYRLDGSLHYAEVAVGTPSTTFLVALDTGSNLFWVPCDCKHCAPMANNASMPPRGSPELQPYSPRNSSTSKPVSCDDALCDQPNACAATNSSSCPYTVSYVSANTSSSGVLVEDVLHLTRESVVGSETVEAAVVLGCGQEQTGAFLDGAAEDGLLGLGIDKVSVPSVLAAGGLVASDSFSMCFSPDGYGRINFGDAGRSGQAETPFIVRNTHPTYNISVTAISVEGKAVAAEFAAVVDSGTSFTYLNDPAYTDLATSFDSQVREKRANLSASIPFEYCYELSRGQTDVFMPEVSLTTGGGAVFPVTQPFVVLAGETSEGKVLAVGYCLAVLKNDITIDIIGQNFMTGLKVVFDRERSVLGWHKFDCYKDVAIEDDGGSPSAAPGPAPATRLKPRQSDAANGTPYPGAVPVPPRQAGTGSSRRALGGRLSFALTLLLPLLGVV
uniref:Uncharacterized protein n=1 Tax=Avena sativa TaxID=4498 RepID=A0ACD5Y978_AVESA